MELAHHVTYAHYISTPKRPEHLVLVQLNHNVRLMSQEKNKHGKLKISNEKQSKLAATVAQSFLFRFFFPTTSRSINPMKACLTGEGGAYLTLPLVLC